MPQANWHFCGVCGNKLVEEWVDCGFNRRTGQPQHRQRRYCPLSPTTNDFGETLIYHDDRYYAALDKP